MKMNENQKSMLPKEFACKFGFTLAEVLITLGVIGVVAALTIPTLMANIQGKRFASQYKKAISTVNQAVRMNYANHDWDFAGINNDCGGTYGDDYFTQNWATDTPDKIKSICAIWNANLKGNLPSSENYTEQLKYMVYFSNNEMERQYAFEDGRGEQSYFVDFSSHAKNSYYTYHMNDGTIIGFNMVAGGLSRPTGMSLNQLLQQGDAPYNIGFIDVNGETGPNKEVRCSNGVTTELTPDNPCVVDAKDITDIYPVVFYDSTVAPATNAASYVLNNSK